MVLVILALALPGVGCATSSRSPTVAAQPAKTAGATASNQGNAASGPQVATGDFLAQAEQLRRSGDVAGATKLLGELVLVAPNDPRVLGAYGKALAAEGHSDDALAFLESAIRLQPSDWTLYSAQGVAYDHLGKYANAQSSYARALQLKPGEPAVLNNDALSHMQAGDLAGAAQLLRQISPNSSEYAQAAKNLALIGMLNPSNYAASTPVQPPDSGAEAQAKSPAVNVAILPKGE